MLEISGICPFCEKMTLLEKIPRKQTVEVRGENITVQTEYFRCVICEGEFDDPETKNELQFAAYREYRRRHGMLQPEDIYRLRKLYNLSQKELSELLFCEEKMLSQCEIGKLQNADHDRMLRMVRNILNRQKNKI